MMKELQKKLEKLQELGRKSRPPVEKLVFITNRLIEEIIGEYEDINEAIETMKKVAKERGIEREPDWLIQMWINEDNPTPPFYVVVIDEEIRYPDMPVWLQGEVIEVED